MSGEMRGNAVTACENGERRDSDIPPLCPIRAAKHPEGALTTVSRPQPASTSNPADSPITGRPTSVYRYYDRYNVLLYVGVTSRGITRNQQHDADKAWWQYVTRQEVEHCRDRHAALRREKALIHKYRPPFNTQHNPDSDSLRAIYLHALADVDHIAPRELRQLFGRCHGRVPLQRIASPAGSIALCVTSDYSPLVKAAQRSGPVLLRAPKKVGVLSHDVMDGRVLVFKTTTDDLPQFTQASLHIKMLQLATFRAHEAVVVAA